MRMRNLNIHAHAHKAPPLHSTSDLIPPPPPPPQIWYLHRHPPPPPQIWYLHHHPPPPLQTCYTTLHLHFRLETSTITTLHLHFGLDTSTSTLHFRFVTSTVTLHLHCKKIKWGKIGCACARRARHAWHRDNSKSRDIMDELDWPLTRMRSLHLYFWGWEWLPPPKSWWISKVEVKCMNSSEGEFRNDKFFKNSAFI